MWHTKKKICILFKNTNKTWIIIFGDVSVQMRSIYDPCSSVRGQSILGCIKNYCVIVHFWFYCYFTMKSFGHLTFLKDTECINHISWQASYSGVVGQHKRDSMVSVLLFVLVFFGILVGSVCLFLERQRKKMKLNE